MNFANDDPYALDLGDEFKQFSRSGDDWQRGDYNQDAADCYVEQPMFSFKSEEELVTSAIFQKHLGMALKHKDRVIRELQNEILEYEESKQ